jgi:hypothetical protein
LIESGIDSREACRVAVANVLSDEEEMLVSMEEMIGSVF